MLFMKKLFCLSALVLLVSACSSIEQPIASRLLVEQNVANVYQELPKNVWSDLSNAATGAVVYLESQQVSLDKLYFSANGKQCRQLLFPNDSLRISCRIGEAAKWYLVKPVISEYIESTSVAGHE